MKPVVFIGGLAIAAAIGAGACYLITQPPARAPGNGAVICPGNGACPSESRASDYYGIAAPNAVLGSRLFLCDGTMNTGGCKRGYVGIMARKPTPTEVQVGTCNGTSPCQPNHSAIYCEVPAGTTPTGICAVLIDR